MKSEVWSMIMWLLMFLGMAYMSGLVFVNIHEQVHATIFQHYNISSVTTVNYFTIAGATIPDKTEYENNCDETCKSLQNETEIVGYHVAVLIATFWAIAFVVCILLWRISSHLFVISLQPKSIVRKSSNKSKIYIRPGLPKD